MTKPHFIQNSILISIQFPSITLNGANVALRSGKLKDQTFEVFDEKVLTWCRKRFGDYYAKGLWRNELTVLDYLNLDDEEDLFTSEMHCSRVYEVLAMKSPKEADHLFRSDRFWSKKWQMEFRQRCRERIFCHLEEICSGEADKAIYPMSVYPVWN
jgi:hypothetical protein